jgi:uncharacterized protein (DUF488 family)
MSNAVWAFTVGHSNHDAARFLALLREAQITAVADVRSAPFSQRYPQFNRPDLEYLLRQEEIHYAFFGDTLGGRPRQPSAYDPDGRVNYERVRAMPHFQKAIESLCRSGAEQRIALLCAEEDPLDCHRGLMIAPALVERGVQPQHLRGDGSTETTDEMEARLLNMTGVGAGMLDGLFAATLADAERADLLREAYRVQARRRAFRLRPEETGD